MKKTINQKPIKVVLFCRVSSKEQEETGYSLPTQEKFLREYAEKKCYQISKVFSVSESASAKSRRKVFKQMLEYVSKHKITAIIVETTDRLLRNFADVPQIDKWVLANENNQIHLVKEGCILHRDSKSHEWFMWRVKVATAEYYIRLLSENVRKGQKEKIEQGWMPTVPPPGYLSVGEKGHKTIVVDEDMKPLVIKMFELYATKNYSLKRLVTTMYKKGLRNRNGRKIVKSRMHELLQDVFYIGKFTWNDVVHKGKHPAIISNELFEKVQKILKRKDPPKYNKHNFLFKGLIKCFECSGTITWETQKNIIYGHCNHYRECKQETWVKEHEVEKQLLAKFQNLELKNKRLSEWLKKALKESHKDEIEYYNASTQELGQRAQQYKNRLDVLYDDKLDGKISEAFYQKKFKQYSEELENTNQDLQKYANASIKYFELGLNIYKLSQKAKQIYIKIKSLEDKQQLIRLVFQDMTLNEGTLEVKYTPAFQILAEAVRVTNSSKMRKTKKLEDKIFEP